MTYADAEAVLLALPRFAEQGGAAFKPGLERMHALLGAMGQPHERFRSVHIAGTNGKGSTASMLASIGTAAGLRVGLHTSPHLHDLAERMRLDGLPAPHDWIADAVARHRHALATIEPSFFEATVALSFLYFAEETVDLAVVEVGLGGRLDATNVLRPALALVTHIDLDHADLLGDTLEAVAREKAGIAKPGVPLLTSAEGAGVVEALRETAEARGARFARVQDEVAVERVEEQGDRLVLDLETPVRAYPRLDVGLAGRHQVWNAALAVRAAERVIEPLSRADVRDGLANVKKHSGLAGRCEQLNRTPLILADVAHNAGGLRAALAWARGRVEGQLYVLFGTMRDKDLAAMADALAAADVRVLPVPMPSPRSVPYSILCEVLRARGVPVIDRDGAAVCDRVVWFERHAEPADGLLATGSHLTVAAARDAVGTPSAA